jgi:primosomal protein N' (replication factor Y)
VLRLAALQDYNDFYASEISLRRELLYPPFCDICEIGFTGVEENAVRGAAADFFERLKTAVFASSGIPVRIMLPSAACVVKISGRYRYRIIIKCRNNQKFRAIISELLRGCGKSKIYRKIAVFADMNPLDIM